MVRAIAKLLLVLQLMHKRCQCNIQHTNKDSLKSEQRSIQLVLYSEVPQIYQLPVIVELPYYWYYIIIINNYKKLLTNSVLFYSYVSRSHYPA